MSGEPSQKKQDLRRQFTQEIVSFQQLSKRNNRVFQIKKKLSSGSKQKISRYRIKKLKVSENIFKKIKTSISKIAT